MRGENIYICNLELNDTAQIRDITFTVARKKNWKDMNEWVAMNITITTAVNARIEITATTASTTGAETTRAKSRSREERVHDK